MLSIRPATEADQQAIMDIYNESVVNNTATFDTEVRTPEKQMEWFRNHKKNHPVVVGEKDGRVIGWASLSPWSDRCAYDTTVEVSVYVHKDYRKQGLGRKLVDKVHNHGREAGCKMTTLSTMSFQDALGFYEKLGYIVDLERPGYVDGSSLICLKKEL